MTQSGFGGSLQHGSSEAYYDTKLLTVRNRRKHPLKTATFYRVVTTEKKRAHIKMLLKFSMITV